MKKDKENDNKNKLKNQNIINEEEKNEEDEEDQNMNSKATGNMMSYKKMESKNLSTFPALISLKDKPQNEKIEEEKKDLDKKLWVPDEHVQNCYNCGEKFFSLFNRKHHCRVCGNIFCKRCLESFWEITIYEEKKELKVCSYCQEKKGELNDILKNNILEYNDDGEKKFETKTWGYVKNKKYDQINTDIFCGFNNIENTLTKEFHDNLNKTYECLLEKMIDKVLNEKADSKFSCLSKNWGNIIFKLTKNVIDNVSPSFQDLNDSININEYIKIKLIKYRDQSLCEVVDGYAMQKNVCSKKMRTNLEKPKILLLKGSLEGLRINPGNKGSLVIKSSAVEDYIEIIRKKIEEIAPKIIMVEGNASQKYQDFFSTEKMDISLITKCSIKQLNRIARCVNSFVVPSPDLIGKQVILGSCNHFRVQTIKCRIENKKNKNDLMMRSEEYNLMRFEGCGKILFNTIILSGPDIDELKELKKLMKIIIKTARFLYCQKFLLKYFNMYYEPSIFGNPWEESDPAPKKNKILRKKTFNKPEKYICGFDTDIIEDSLNEVEWICMKMHNNNRNDIISNVSRATVGISADPEKNPMSIKESEVLKKSPNKCDAFSLTMNAYSVSEEEEKTFGKFIFSFFEDGKERCDKCGDLNFYHTTYLYKNDGRIKIELFTLNENLYQIDKMSEFLGFIENPQNKEKVNKNLEGSHNSIYSYGFCEICQNIVTPLVKLPKEILNFSATKFYKNVLYNKKLINFADKNRKIFNFQDSNDNEDAAKKCNQLKHLHYKDISKIFITKFGVVKVQYQDIIKYNLIGSQLNVKNDYYVDYHKGQKIKTMATDKSLTLKALENIKHKFNCHKSMIEDVKSELFGQYIEKIMKVVDDSFTRIDELIKINEQLFGNENDYENIFIYYHHLKIYLIKIMNIKTLSNKLLKIIKRIIKLVFFEEMEETNKVLKEQELKVINDKPEGDSLPRESAPLLKCNKTLGRSTVMETNKDLFDLTLNNNSNFEDRTKSQIIGKEKNDSSKKKSSNESSKINVNENDNNNDNNDNNSISSNSDNGDDHSYNNKNNSDIENNEISNLNIASELQSGNVTFNLENVNADDSNKILVKASKKNSIDKDKESEEDKSNSRLIDLSMKRVSITYGQINSNPELREQINNKYKNCFNKINKYITSILELDKMDEIQQIISKLNFYDKKHNSYSCLINDEDLCSIITYTLTSDQYLETVKFDGKNGLNDIKSEFVNKDIYDNGDNDLYCDTSLLYDKDKIKFSLGNFSEEKISQILENELLSSVNKKCVYEVTYNPSSLFNEVFEKKKKKENKTNNSKINYFPINQNLYSMNAELKSIKDDTQKILEERFDDFNKKFNFPSIKPFEEETLPTSKLKVTAFYAKHFESLRILCGASYFQYLHSIMKSQEWSSVTGGKSKAHFFKSFDERFVVKCLSEMEFKMFIDSCFIYFVHNNKYFFVKMPSCLVKIVGAYKIKIKSSKKNLIYCVIMENLNYLLNNKKTSIVTYDLKGSSINRYIKEKENGRVLMDTNFIEDFCGEPLAFDQKIYALMICSISNDLKYFRKIGVIDYSLLCLIVDYNNDGDINEDENNDNKIIFKGGENKGKIKYIRFGILDYFRKYTWDKQLETFGKTIMHKFAAPTVINPKKYHERFLNKMKSYFIGC